METAWLKDIKGMWVASLDEGRMLGTVNNIYIDDQKKVAGMALRIGSPLSGQDIWLPYESIIKIGEDLIYVQNDNAVGPAPPTGKRLIQWLGMPVSGKDGRALGQLADMAINLEDAAVIELALTNDHTVAIQGLETVFGQDMILVQAGAVPQERVKEKKETIVESVFGKEFVKHTSEVIKRVLKGSEAELKPGEPDAAEFPEEQAPLGSEPETPSEQPDPSPSPQADEEQSH